MDFDRYCVRCVRDELHGERFVIAFGSLAEGKMKRTAGPLDEEGVRAEMRLMGLSAEKIEDHIRRARTHADAGEP